MQITQLSHPLVRHKLGLLRNKDISTQKFRQVVTELTISLTYEASRTLATEFHSISNWCGEVEIEAICGKKPTVVPVLRAGMGMLDGLLTLIPNARISMVGMYRNHETFEPVVYFEKLVQHLDQRPVFVIDPMLATGGTLVATIDLLKLHGARQIAVMVLVASPEGLEKLALKHPDIQLFTASIDEHLDNNGYVVPGLGDAGDRLFGTR
ncbi:uracil phosphoribosyltransferase [Thalassotalea mangrovi]|uniref:Uracil phosphoribosyltransferase n=1 Tax=Thalassotalea mangrovi TaxID=2572245 RepID=A0A4U1B5L3_9GAMM|nr:uracil phosphoribosyltransferase [Thalassotalea mangrovi]TKB45708.1 uracil phosphoribosyltransferase [Thalassotalea mangrovi]